MRHSALIALLAPFTLAAVSAPDMAQAIDTQAATMTVTAMADGFDTPWAIGFLPGGGYLVTEREGRLWHVAPDGTRQQIGGLPEIRVAGQGGLLDVIVPRDFARSAEVIFSYVKPQGRGAGTALARATLNLDAGRLENLQQLFEMAPGTSGGQHFGGRIVEGQDGTLFMTMGDRGDRDQSQNLASHNGTVIRINRDESVPSDNPFVALDGALPEIWSYGHRNPQGATLDANGQLWLNEHGARGGDEVNIVQRGANYGWPVISYGRHYSGARIGEGTARAGMEQPVFYWDPSMAPSGMAIYTGDMFPDWRGQSFVGSLKFDYIARLDGQMREVEQIKGPETARVRDVRQAPDGTLWFISEASGTIYRISR